MCETATATYARAINTWTPVPKLPRPVHHAAAVTYGEPGATRLAAMAKRHATDAGFEIVNGCLQLHGGYGYLRDHPIERVLRDVRVHQILEGTNEVMRLIVSRDILGN